MLLTSQKCDQQGMNCENYITFGYPDCCHIWNIPFFSFVKGFDPEIKSCPIRKVIYLHLREFSWKLFFIFQTILRTLGLRYDMSAWTQLAMYNKYLAKYHFVDEDKNTLFCFELDWAILPKRASRRPNKM
jgi:hypothetical protein